MPNAYYNENDPKAAAWLRCLIKEGLITDGEVDERSIKDVQGSDLDGFDRVHLFAGIGGWDLALQLAGWEGTVWTGSCPCQPFSAAGKRKGTADERHLWPEMFRLIAECRPATIFGEQVASKAGREWLAGVFADLESVGYAVAGADLCAASVGAPHIRQRLWWVAEGMEHTESNGRQQWRSEPERRSIASGCGDGVVADTTGGDAGQVRCERQEDIQRSREHRQQPQDGLASKRLGNTNSISQKAIKEIPVGSGASSTRNAWDDFRLIECRDGKTRRIESSTEPLVDGLPGRVGLLRGYGNAIVPQVAAGFIESYLEVC